MSTVSPISPVEEKTHLSDNEAVILDKILSDSHYEEEVPQDPVDSSAIQDPSEEVDLQSPPPFEVKSILKKHKRSKDKSKGSSTKGPKDSLALDQESAKNESVYDSCGTRRYI